MGKLVFHRRNEIQDLSKDMSREELFSVYGGLVGYYSIGRSHLAFYICRFIKRRAEGVEWRDKVEEKTTPLSFLFT